LGQKKRVRLDRFLAMNRDQAEIMPGTILDPPFSD